MATPLQAVARELRQLMELDVSHCKGLTSMGLACVSSLSNLTAPDLAGCNNLDEKGRLRSMLDGEA